jgi:hypothetical protein
MFSVENAAIFTGSLRYVVDRIESLLRQHAARGKDPAGRILSSMK